MRHAQLGCEVFEIMAVDDEEVQNELEMIRD